MATVAKKYVLDLMLKERLPFFWIADSATSIRPTAQNDSEADVDAAIELMEEAIANIQDSFVYMRISNANRAEKKNGGDVKRYNHYEFRVNLIDSGNRKAGTVEPGAAAGPMNKQVFDLLERNNELQRKIERLEDQKRFDDLQRQIIELKTGSPIEKLLANERIVEGIAGMLGGPKVGIAGGNDAAVNETEVDRLSKLRKALTRLGKVDSKIDEHIELLAQFAEKNSVMYFASIEQVKKMLSS